MSISRNIKDLAAKLNILLLSIAGAISEELYSLQNKSILCSTLYKFGEGVDDQSSHNGLFAEYEEFYVNHPGGNFSWDEKARHAEW